MEKASGDQETSAFIVEAGGGVRRTGEAAAAGKKKKGGLGVVGFAFTKSAWSWVPSTTPSFRASFLAQAVIIWTVLCVPGNVVTLVLWARLGASGGEDSDVTKIPDIPDNATSLPAVSKQEVSNKRKRSGRSIVDRKKTISCEKKSTCLAAGKESLLGRNLESKLEFLLGTGVREKVRESSRNEYILSLQCTWRETCTHEASQESRPFTGKNGVPLYVFLYVNMSLCFNNSQSIVRVCSRKKLGSLSTPL